MLLSRKRTENSNAVTTCQSRTYTNRTGKPGNAGRQAKAETLPKNPYREVRRYEKNPGLENRVKGGQTNVPLYDKGGKVDFLK